MKKSELEARVRELEGFIDELLPLLKLAKRYNQIGPGYIEELIEKVEESQKSRNPKKSSS